MQRSRFIRKLQFILNRLSNFLQVSEFFFRLAKPRNTSPTILENQLDIEEFDSQNSLAPQIDRSIFDTLNESLMPFPIRRLQGMSGQRFRSLLNKLSQIDISGSYLEIGTYKGSTACSALYQNSRSAILVDNWSEFGGPKEIAFSNLSAICADSEIDFVDTAFLNFYTCPVQNKIALYFYDGGHSLEEQRLAVTLIDTLNFDYLIFLVDDFSWETVKQGTIEGLKILKSTIIKTWTILPAREDRLFRYGEWHNGYLICLIRKAKN